jgi:hypothetical protein
MVKNHSLLNIIVLFLCIISFSKSDIKWVFYDFSQGYVEEQYNGNEKSQTFGLEFGESKSIPYYIKVEVTSTDSNPAPLLCFSSSDQTCSEKENVVKNPNGNSVLLWAKREQFEKDNQELYARVECAEAGCKYKIRFTGDQSASFPPNFVYSYLVGTANKEMRFDILGTQTNIYLTVTLEGSSKAQVSVENQYEGGISFKNGQAMTLWIEGEEEQEEEEEEETKPSLRASNMASIIVKSAEVGDYITISVHIVDDNEYEFLGVAPKDYALPNGPEISGYLEAGILNEECLPLDLSD